MSILIYILCNLFGRDIRRRRPWHIWATFISRVSWQLSYTRIEASLYWHANSLEKRMEYKHLVCWKVFFILRGCVNRYFMSLTHSGELCKCVRAQKFCIQHSSSWNNLRLNRERTSWLQYVSQARGWRRTPGVMQTRDLNSNLLS